jgi:ATP-dependent Zn protease
MKRISASAGKMMDVGKSKAKFYMEKETNVSFQDVAGVDEAKAELMEVVLFAIRHNADSVSMDDFTSAIERIVAGLEKKNVYLTP